MTPATLFDAPADIIDEPESRYRTTDPDTSIAAAKAVTPRLSGDRLLVLRTLFERGPLTDFEVADHCGRAQTSLGVRRADLVKLGFVAKTEARRLTPSGSPSIVWALTHAGIAHYRQLAAS